MRDSFAEYHPFINLLYFALVIGFSLAVSHPLIQIISLLCAIVYILTAEGRKSMGFVLKLGLPMVLLTAIINPLFNHEGSTVLLEFSNGNPLTLESILYGLSAGIMLVTVLLWFSSFSRVMTTDKFIYLFGKIMPALSLILSMTLRFVPKFRAQMTTVADAQRCIGKDVSDGSLLSRIKTASRIFSIMVTWSLENAIETADSMKSRGYGLRDRTFFSVYKFDERDKYALIWYCFCGMLLTAGVILSAFGFSYFPVISHTSFDMKTIPFYCVFFALCITPVVLNLKEEIKWKILRSEM